MTVGKGEDEVTASRAEKGVARRDLCRKVVAGPTAVRLAESLQGLKARKRKVEEEVEAAAEAAVAGPCRGAGGRREQEGAAAAEGLLSQCCAGAGR